MFAKFRPPYLLTTLFWYGDMLIGRAIRDDVPPLSLAFWRWTIALALPHPMLMLAAFTSVGLLALAPAYTCLLPGFVGYVFEVPQNYHFIGIALIFTGIFLTTSHKPH